MDLSDIFGAREDHERGAWLELAHPVTGEPIGIRFHLAGPDSDTQAKGRLKFADDLADLAEADGTMSAEAREKARINSLARCVLGWEITEDGEPVPFTHKNVVRVLRAATWIQAQVDAFAGDRQNFGGL